MSIQPFFKRMGPAWVISAVACGPATMAGVSVAGSTFGYDLLWVVILSALFAFVAQFMAARAGLLSGRGIVSLVDRALGPAWGWALMIDALLATWLASTVLMKALVDVTGLVTGLSTPWWSAGYVILLGLLMATGGYRALEFLCKIMVALVVLCFLFTVAKTGFNPLEVAGGLAPTVPGGMESALTMAGIMGGAVHVTIIGMHTYNVNSKGWGREQMNLARTDTFLSMFVAFGLYSAAVYLAAAAILHPRDIQVRHALDVAKALQPFLGPYASGIFLAGIWGAVLTTITPTFLAAGYFFGDKMGWPLHIGDKRFRAVVLAGCLLSFAGPFLKGGFMTLLVVMLALGLCGTPFILLLLLVLLNRKDVAGEDVNPLWLNILGSGALAVTTLLALRFVASKLG